MGDPGTRRRRRLVLTSAMPVEGDYEPSTAAWVREQVELYESSGGTKGTTLRDTGLPVVIVTNRGAKSGKVHKTPVMRVEHGGRYAMVASKGGAPDNPLWYYSVRANPLVEVQDGAHRHDYRAREISGAERAEWWERAVAAFPPYAEYQQKTTRQIPVFVLEPASES
jgi:deazaflavin-dependent oxidoreductase (nitroreductase family)